MTTLVAVRKNGVAVIASDSQMSSGAVALSLDEQKIHSVGGVYIAFTGSCASQQAIQHYIEASSLDVDLRTKRQLFEFFKEVHKALKDEYFLSPEDKHGIEQSGSAMLAITPKGVFSIEEGRSVHEYAKFIAHGHGREYALGAAQAIYGKNGVSAESVAHSAIDAAVRFDIYTGGAVQCESVRLA